MEFNLAFKGLITIVISGAHLKEKTLDRTMWKPRFGRGFGPLVRQTTK
jgi:hypothetical protein